MNPPSRQPEGFPGQRLVVVPSDVVSRGGSMPVVRDLQVTHLGHFSSAPGHYVQRPDGAPQWVMIYCLGGLGAVQFGGRRFELGEEDLVLLPPGEAHLYEADLLAPWSICWVHFGGQRWTVARMARLAGLSTPHFAELFREWTGSPPIGFLIRLRLQRACSILERESVSIEETARRVGYEDPYYFSRIFHKYLGVPPSAYRKEAHGG